ncbi:MAG: hypothetical protein JNJ49_14170 [Bdellovibrionaceae bacterium]|nr:hypothetical protein [Pseudobdellovibrionaceae bacterium]
MGKPIDRWQNQEMVKLILCLAVTLLVRPVMADDLCDQFMNSAVGLEENSSVWLDGGKLTRSSKSNEVLSFEDGKKARVKLAHFVGDDMLVLPSDVAVAREGDVTTVSRRVASTEKLHPADLIGFEARFKNMPGGCLPLQNVALFRDRQGEMKKIVFDSVYCDRIREVAARAGRDKVKGCTDWLGEMNQVFSDRRAELAQQGIVMSDSRTPLSNAFVGKTEELSASAVMQAMVFCSPKDWAGFNMDLQMKIAETGQPSSSKAKGVRQ